MYGFAGIRRKSEDRSSDLGTRYETNETHVDLEFRVFTIRYEGTAVPEGKGGAKIYNRL